MVKKALAPLVLFYFLLFSIHFCVADWRVKPDHWGVEQGTDIPGLDIESEKVLDDAQTRASQFLRQAADWVDSFFDDERVLEEENKSRATAKLSFSYSRNDKFEVKPRLDIRLKLPRLSERTQLIISKSEDSDFDTEDGPIANRPGSEEEEDNSFTAALRFFLSDTKKRNISFDTGASWSYLYASFRFRTTQNFNSWIGRFTNRLRWYTDDGFENKTSYDLETQLSADFFFRATTTASLYQDLDSIPHSQNFRLYQLWSSHQAVSYETGVYFDTEPSYKVIDTQLIVKYRQRFYRDWLVLEVSPRITFPEEYDREPNPGIGVKLEAAIGYKADEAGYRKVFR